MIDTKEDYALKIAEYLLDIKAIKIQPNDPFTWASGWKSPIYCDNRKILSYPKIRTHIRQQIANIIKEEFGNIDVIIGVATGGLPYASLVAEELGLPLAYVRQSKKEHGLKNKIEGEVTRGQNAAIIEDLISTGKSSLYAVKVVREAGCEVKGMVSIFRYGFPIAAKQFDEANCRVISLCDYETMIKQATNSGYIEEKDILSLKEWRENPDSWGQEK